MLFSNEKMVMRRKEAYRATKMSKANKLRPILILKGRK
jgi:hypothetical protein